MRSRFSKLIVLLAALQLVGGSWIALQSVAWAGMLADYARGETIGVAIEKTFDGGHPCELCKVVKRGRSEEQKQTAVKSLVKLEAVVGALFELPVPRAQEWRYRVLIPKLEPRTLVPLTLPPRAA